MPVTSRGQSWEILHSLWIAWTFTFGFFGWIAFFYVGIRARRTRWILWGVVYSVPFILAMAIADTAAGDGALGTLLVLLTLVLGVAGIVHAFWIRKEYLMRLDARLRSAVTRDAMLRSRVDAEYGGGAVQAARNHTGSNATGTYSQLASIKETIALPPQQVLDSAQAFLVKRGYRISQRKDTSIFAQRPDPEAAPKATYDLLVTASPQPGGGVRITIVGDDRRGVEMNKTAWSGWAESLPKQVSEARTATDEETAASEIFGSRESAGGTSTRPGEEGETRPLSAPEVIRDGSRSSSPSRSGVDLNTSSERELAALPGVGIIIAKRAVAVRESKRGFRSIEDFGQALGLKPHVVERIRPLVSVSSIEQSQQRGSSGRIVDF